MRNQVSALWQKPGSAAEGTFGRRTWLGRQAFRLPKLPPKRDFRLCLGLSAAEGAAEPALFSLPLHVLYDCFEVF